MDGLKMADITMAHIDNTARRLDEWAEGGDPYGRLGAMAGFTFHRDQLTSNLVYNTRLFYSDTMYSKDEVIAEAYNDYVSDMNEAGITPLGETLSKQFMKDAFRAVVEWIEYHDGCHLETAYQIL